MRRRSSFCVLFLCLPGSTPDSGAIPHSPSHVNQAVPHDARQSLGEGTGAGFWTSPWTESAFRALLQMYPSANADEVPESTKVACSSLAVDCES